MSHRKARFVAALLLLTGGQDVGAREPSVNDDTNLRAALATARWIQSHTIETDRGITWPVAPLDSPESATNLYAGSPGVVLFFTELARITGDPGWLEAVRQGADELVGQLDSITTGSGTGLYTGVAGVGFTLQSLNRTTPLLPYQVAAASVVEHIRATAHSQTPHSSWASTSDIIGGLAGTGLFLIFMADKGSGQDDFSRAQALNLAKEAADRLLELGRERDDGTLSWEITPGFRNSYPNFSHGTAGVCFFMAKLARAMPDDPDREIWLNAAVKGAHYLISIADTSIDNVICQVPRFDPDEYVDGEPQLFYQSWCHGPPGTARLFQQLFNTTGDVQWLIWRNRCGEAVLRANLAGDDSQERLAGWWNNVGPCCGNVGVAQFALDMHARSSDRGYLQLARRLTDDLLARASRVAAVLPDEEPDTSMEMMYWVHAEHRVRPDFQQAQTGYMQGSAGIGLWLLRMHAFENDIKWTLRLPDDPF